MLSIPIGRKLNDRHARHFSLRVTVDKSRAIDFKNRNRRRTNVNNKNADRRMFEEIEVALTIDLGFGRRFTSRHAQTLR